MPRFLSYDVLHPATLKTSPKLPKIRLRWKPIPSHLSTIGSYIHHMIWPTLLTKQLGVISLYGDGTPNSPACRINLGGDVHPAVDTKSVLFFKPCKHPILRNTSKYYPKKKEKHVFFGMLRAWTHAAPLFFYFGSAKIHGVWSLGDGIANLARRWSSDWRLSQFCWSLWLFMLST